jgi:uncharacterized RDD family membrane protein YckC
MLALAIDWLASIAITMVILGGYHASQTFQVVTLATFLVESTVFTASIGGSFGQIATRLRVVRVDGDPRPLDPIRTLARQVLVCLVVPPLVFRPDGRGLHDMAVGTATTTLATYRGLSQAGGQ